MIGPLHFIEPLNELIFHVTRPLVSYSVSQLCFWTATNIYIFLNYMQYNITHVLKNTVLID